jgi:proline iminopeptidase
VREKATADWCAWEDAVLSDETNGGAAYAARPSAARLAFVRICSRYFANGAWLEEELLLREAHQLAGIPSVLIHCRLDRAVRWTPPGTWPAPGRGPSSR